MIEFRLRSDGACKITFNLDVINESQIPILIGSHGRNIKYLKERIECELTKKYQKEVLVNITVTRSRERIDVSNENVENIIAPGYGTRRAKEELEALTKGELSLEDLTKKR